MPSLMSMKVSQVKILVWKGKINGMLQIMKILWTIFMKQDPVPYSASKILFPMTVINYIYNRTGQRWLSEPNQRSHQLSWFKFQPNQSSNQILGFKFHILPNQRSNQISWFKFEPNQSLSQIHSVWNNFQVPLLGQIFANWVKI